MARDWSNERFVKLYRDESPDEAVWCWQAIALWPQLIRKADHAGEIRTRKGLRGVAALTRLPLEIVVEAGMEELLADGCVVETPTGYRIPNYIEAQRAVASNNRRTAEWRARERAKESANGEQDNNDVTPGDAAETFSDETKRDVTPRDSELNRDELNRTEEEHTPRAHEPRDRVLALSQEALSHVRRVAGTLAAELGVVFQQGNAIEVEGMALKATAAWMAEGGEELVRSRIRHLVAFRSERARARGDLLFWEETTWWSLGNIAKDLGQPIANARKSALGRDGPGGSSRQPTGAAAGADALEILRRRKQGQSP